MPELTTVLLLALLREAGNAVGGLLAEITPCSDVWLNRALHVAAGVVIAVVASEIRPEAPPSRAECSGRRSQSEGCPTWAFEALIERRTGEGDHGAEDVYLAVVATCR